MAFRSALSKAALCTEFQRSFWAPIRTGDTAVGKWIYTNGNMIRQHYGTWINEDGPDVVGMLQLALKLSPVTALL
ncbi:hypothetical protein E4T65_23915 [Pseudomonas fluorescens]|uniref:Uncharacterized protein n=1 Tax=Pseudomonas fluorescens TaxID=294 RepID=A0A4Y9TA80_PSEFL|nr:hypothetical protein E4T65_23915 [Pseudomonas fluorescens]